MNPAEQIALLHWTSVLYAACALTAAAVIHFALARFTSRQRRLAENAAVEGVARSKARLWIAHVPAKASAPLALLVWILALHFALSVLLGDMKQWSEAPHVVAALDWLRGAAVLLAVFWLLVRIGRAIDAYLTALPTRTRPKADDIILPLVGKYVRVILPMIAVLLGASALEVSPQTRALLRDATSLLIIGAVAFMLLQTVDAMQTFLLSRYRLDVSDNYRARAVHTQVRMLRRVAVVLIAVLAFASMLMVFDSVRRFGTTILASAGVAGIVIGFAAQRSIATLLAGFQIALTQPIRIDDVVIVENEWGRIEEITLTYVVVNLWDLRRLVVPITYFIEKPFQNWTRTSSQILGTVFFYLDYRVPLTALRAEYERVVASSALWDKQVCVLQVTDTKESCIEVRGLVSATDAARAFDLRCEVRERLLSWLTAHYPYALPGTRVRFSPDSEGADVVLT